MKKVGLVGGISWVSTIDYYKLINEGVNKKMGGLHFAECLIYSLNFGDVQEKTWENSFELLLAACNSLKKSDVEAIALCANTAHLFASQLEEKVGLPFINIISETGKAVKQKGIKKVALLGTKFTMEMDFYRDKLNTFNVEAIIPYEQETRNYIQHTVKEELGRGIINANTKQAYINIINNLIKQGAEGIILGCTEIPMLVSQEDVEVPVFDTATIHANAIVDFITG
jgi:aspartate racemase